MYEDDEPWPITCPRCGQHFQQKVGWLKVRDAIRCPCPACRLLYEYSREKLCLEIAEAREGRYDPLRHIHRAKTVSEFPEGGE
jgi:hypothetical protein